MTESKNDATGKDYEVRLKGVLDESWADSLEGFTFKYECDGTTTITGQIVDQAALHGLLKRIRDLGIPLLAVNQIGAGQNPICRELNEKENADE
jgi:hypothetical protein